MAVRGGLCVARRCLPSGRLLRPGTGSSCSSSGRCGHGSKVVSIVDSTGGHCHLKTNGSFSTRSERERLSVSAATPVENSQQQLGEDDALQLQQQRPEIIWTPHGIGWDCGITEDEFWLCPEMRQLSAQLRTYRPSGVEFLSSVRQEVKEGEEEEEKDGFQGEGGGRRRRRGGSEGDASAQCPKSEEPYSSYTFPLYQRRSDDGSHVGVCAEGMSAPEVPCEDASCSALGSSTCGGLLMEMPAAKGKRVRTLCRVKKNAAVLVPLFRRNGELCVLLTKRASTMNSHSGEVALPGGKRDEEDSDDAATALREAFEEIGLPPAKVRVVARLEPFLSKHLLTVSPVVGLLPSTGVPKLQLNEEEVETVFDMPLEVFLKEEDHIHEDLEWLGLPYRVHHFWHDSDGARFHIWGLTAAILIRTAAAVFQRAPAFSEFHPAVPDYATVLKILAQRRLLQL